MRGEATAKTETGEFLGGDETDSDGESVSRSGGSDLSAARNEMVIKASLNSLGDLRRMAEGGSDKRERESVLALAFLFVF